MELFVSLEVISFSFRKRKTKKNMLICSWSYHIYATVYLYVHIFNGRTTHNDHARRPLVPGAIPMSFGDLRAAPDVLSRQLVRLTESSCQAFGDQVALFGGGRNVFFAK